MPLLQEVVTVVVVTYNSAEVLPGLIESLPDGLDGSRGTSSSSTTGRSMGPFTSPESAAPTATLVQMGRNAGYAAGVKCGGSRGVRSHGRARAQRRRTPRPRLRRGAPTGLRMPGIGIAVPKLTGPQGRPHPFNAS